MRSFAFVFMKHRIHTCFLLRPLSIRTHSLLSLLFLQLLSLFLFLLSFFFGGFTLCLELVQRGALLISSDLL